jgi:hypothetical protein
MFSFLPGLSSLSFIFHGSINGVVGAMVSARRFL